MNQMCKNVSSNLGSSKFYSRIANHYALTPSAVIIRTAEAELISSLPILPPALDLCCGDGFITSMVHPGEFEAGCDISQDALNKARNLDYYKILEYADVSKNIPFPDSQFETVISNSSLEHVKDIGAALKETARVLKPGGKLYVTFASDYAYDWWPVGKHALQKYLGFQPVYHYDSLKKWEERFNQNGLRVSYYCYYLSKPATKVLLFMDYHLSNAYLGKTFSLARPIIKSMSLIPKFMWAAIWKMMFASITINTQNKGGGIIIAAERTD